MKIANGSASMIGSYCTGIALAFALGGAGPAGADTYRQGGSTATIQQSGGGEGTAQVTRHKDGQTIITRDGRSTDITIQREGRSPPPDISRESSITGMGRFKQWFAGEPFPRDPDEPSTTTDDSKGRRSAHDAFKQRMLDRMRGH